MKCCFLLFLILATGCSKSITSKPPKIPSYESQILNGALVSGGNVSEKFKPTPNGLKVVYIADEITNNENELFVTDGNLRKRIVDVPTGRNVTHFVISPDSTLVAFLADIDTAGLQDLYIVDIEGNNIPQRINEGLNLGETVFSSYKFSEDSSKILFVTDEVSGVKNLYIANTTSPHNRTQLNSVPFAPVHETFLVSSDRAVYRYFASPPTGNPTIRSVLLNISNDVLVSSSFNGTEGASSDFILSPNGQKVVYRANQDDPSINEIYITNTNGLSSIQKLNGSIVSGGQVKLGSFKFSPNGLKVVYVADQEVDDEEEIYSVNVDGSSLSKLNSATPLHDMNVESFLISGDSQKVIYLSDEINDGVYELYSSNISSPTSNTKISDTLLAKQVGLYEIVGSRVVFHKETLPSVYDIFVANFDGSQNTQVTNTIAGSGFYDQTLYASNKTMTIMKSTDQSKVAFVGNENTSSPALHIMNVSNLSIFKHESIIPNTNSEWTYFSFLPNYNKVIYRNGSPNNLKVLKINN